MSEIMNIDYGFWIDAVAYVKGRPPRSGQGSGGIVHPVQTRFQLRGVQGGEGRLRTSASKSGWPGPHSSAAGSDASSNVEAIEI